MKALMHGITNDGNPIVIECHAVELTPGFNHDEITDTKGWTEKVLFSDVRIEYQFEPIRVRKINHPTRKRFRHWMRQMKNMGNKYFEASRSLRTGNFHRSTYLVWKNGWPK